MFFLCLGSNKTKDKTSKKYKGAKKTKAVSTEETRHWSLDASKAKETELLEDGKIVSGGPGTGRPNKAKSKSITIVIVVSQGESNTKITKRIRLNYYSLPYIQG